MNNTAWQKPENAKHILFCVGSPSLDFSFGLGCVALEALHGSRVVSLSHTKGWQGYENYSMAKAGKCQTRPLCISGLSWNLGIVLFGRCVRSVAWVWFVTLSRYPRVALDMESSLSFRASEMESFCSIIASVRSVAFRQIECKFCDQSIALEGVAYFHPNT